MKVNKWTVGLAALGVVSVASVASAEEQMNKVQTMVSGTTISGYVDTSAEWNPGTGNLRLPGYRFNNSNMADGFNLDVVKLTIEKPLDESQWAAGYKFDTLYGPYANQYNTASAPLATGQSDFAIQQAYVALRAPVGNGLDFKMGVFNTIIGYESFDSGNNPNFTHSYGNTIEPLTHTGVLAMYRFNEIVQVAGGVADTVGPQINERGNLTWNNSYTGPAVAESYKTYMGSIALTAPESMGFLAGSTLYGGIVNGFNSNVTGTGSNPGFAANQTSWYAGATVKTPITGLRGGVAYDYLGISKQPLTGDQSAYANSIAGYLSYQATEKLSLHLRGEYYSATSGYYNSSLGTVVPSKIVAATATIQYDLWQNVISRVEFRWDHQADGEGYAYGQFKNQGVAPYGDGDRRNAYMLALNVIYKF